MAVQYGHIDSIEALLEGGADSNQLSIWPDPAWGKTCVVFQIPDTPPPPHEPDLCQLDPQPGVSPLQYAVIADKPRIAEAQLLAGANPNLRSKRGRCGRGKDMSAYEYAAQDKRFATFRALVDSPLHLAAGRHDVRQLKALILNADDLDAKLLQSGSTPLEIALLARSFDAVEFLLSVGSDTEKLTDARNVQDRLEEYIDSGRSPNLRRKLRDSGQ